MVDKIICRGLSYRCFIGFHEFEKNIEQNVLVDFEAEVPTIAERQSDQVDAIVIDYSQANQKIAQFFSQERFNLIETVAENIADLLLKAFPIQAVKVTLTKKPLDIPNMESVSYECYRVQKKSS